MTGITDVKGVGGATAERLEAAGVTTVDDLATVSQDKLTEQGLSDSKAAKLISRAKRQTVVLQSGADARAEAESKDYISTGMDALDDVLGGGYREEHIVGISGEASAGKTQVAFRAIGAAVEQTGLPAVYIETERERFDPDRIANLSELDRDEVDEKVYRAKAYSLDQQSEAYEAVADHFNDVSLVVVDSFTSRFRLSEQFEGRASLPERSQEIARHLNSVEAMVEDLGCPAILTLQVMGNPSPYGSNTSTYGSMLMDHTLTYKLKMSHAQGQFRKAQLRGHPSEADGEVLLTISEDGLDAHKEK